MSELEIIKDISADNFDIKIILFDFDGTISTLREGWENLMEPIMISEIAGDTEPTPGIKREVREYIDESTGIQTIYQMQWLQDKVKEYGLNPEIKDPWDYKAIYNEKLLKMVNKRLDKISKGQKDPGDYRIKGSIKFLQELKDKGYELYLASGTDHPDVVHETKVLGVNKYFKEIAGAPVDEVNSSKKAVIKHLFQERKLSPSQLLIIGDGKVEIALGAERGSVTIGAATVETERGGINSWKRERLIDAGAHAIIGDFADYEQIRDWLNL